MTLPSVVRLSLVRTKAGPLPGLTCWNSTILKIVPSTSMWVPFLNWLVEIIGWKGRHRAAGDRGPGRRVCDNPAMDSTTLRETQAPLKERYRDDPNAAVVTLSASGRRDEGISCSVDTGRKAAAVAGLHPVTGGDGSLLCSGDLLLEAPVACAGVTLRAVSTSLGIEVTGGTITADGELDFRGTLAVDREAPV